MTYIIYSTCPQIKEIALLANQTWKWTWNNAKDLGNLFYYLSKDLCLFSYRGESDGEHLGVPGFTGGCDNLMAQAAMETKFLWALLGIELGTLCTRVTYLINHCAMLLFYGKSSIYMENTEIRVWLWTPLSYSIQVLKGILLL